MEKRILVVEDEPNIVASLVFLLQHAGFKVDTEDNGETAYNTVLSNPPDVLVLDVMLPGMDGFEILRKLRESEATKSLPILMLTAKGQRADRQNALDFGADMFITKPFSNAEVVSAVEQLANQEAA